MAHQAKKTEHTGAKKGEGAYWGPRRDAKRESNRARRVQDAKAADEGLADGTPLGFREPPRNRSA